MSPVAVLLLVLSAIVGGVIGVWQARRRARQVVAQRIADAVEARLIERYGRPKAEAKPRGSDGKR